jgi:hypothetical protein
MKLSSFHIGNTPGVRTTDFHVGRYCLAKHFAISAINALDASPKYARQLLLEEPSDFPSGRVPIFVCECCADLACGARTVAVEIADDIVTWRDFGLEAPYGETLVVPEIYARTGPFYFDLTAYRSALRPYTRAR